MIIVRFTGGLGNQMFQYAFAKNLAIKKNVELKFDISLLGEPLYKSEHLVIRNFDLDIFNLNFALVSKKEIESFNGKQNPSILDRIKYKFNRLTERFPLVIQNENDFDLKQLALIKSNCCVVGRWQSELFFKENRNIIKQDFDFNSFTPNPYSIHVSKIMERTMSVGIHIRRGDYVSNPIYSKGIGALAIQYYYDAIALMKNRLDENAHKISFFFISDDIEWCKKVFLNLPNSFFVEQEKSKIGYTSDLWLLTLCKHVIISNSTFAWWGAWLSENDSSIIIAPKNWAKEKKYNPDYIIPNRWISIDNEFEK